ncbi:MAG TPA: hypothetical protein VII30_02715 [Gemmatimonadaceae bacterium]
MATNSNLRDPRALGWVLYLLALLLIVGPLSQWTVIVWPMHLDVVQWRYGSIGLLEERLTLPMVGLFTAMLAASLLEHRAVQGTLAGLSLLAAPMLAALAVVIALDGIELRYTVPAKALGGFDGSLARTVLVLLYAAVVAAVLGWAGLKARGKKAPRRSESTPLTVRRPVAQGGTGA